MSCSFAHDDGAYVLGALSTEDRLAFERHLADCEPCSRSVRELAGLPGLLARIPATTLEADPTPRPVPDTLLPGLVRRARRVRHRRAWVASGLIAAAAVVVALTVGAAILGGDDPAPSATSTAGPTTAAPRVMEPVGDEPIDASLSLTEVGWGTRLDMICRYREEAGEDYHDRPPPAYAMFVTKTDGTVEQVASWKALPGKSLRLTAATAASQSDIVQVVVRAADGTEVLTLPG